MTRTPPRRLLATLLLGAALLTASCSAGTTTSGAAAAPAQDRNEQAAPGGAKAPAATANPQQTGGGGGAVTENRLLSRTASVTVQVPDVQAAAARLRVIAAGKGGIISAENVVVTDGGAGKPSTLVIVVPAERLDATLDDIAAVGTVKVRTVNTTDVTTQVADIDARVRTARESIARLQELIKRAGSVAEVAQVENELTKRQAELESLLAKQKALSAMVAESPITVTLVTPATVAETPVENPSFLLGLKRGWAAFASFIGYSLMTIGAFLPFLIFFGLIGAGVWWIAKRVGAKRRASRPDPRPTPPAGGSPRPAPRPAPAPPVRPASQQGPAQGRTEPVPPKEATGTTERPEES